MTSWESCTPGQARKSLWIETHSTAHRPSDGYGQARKSLWIETNNRPHSLYGSQVRLVRACGSKHIIKFYIISNPGQARKSLWIETFTDAFYFHKWKGQARKSLWIETPYSAPAVVSLVGQARKSLWIETSFIRYPVNIQSVRLVRACGSKRLCYHVYNKFRMVRLVRACGSKPPLRLI